MTSDQLISPSFLFRFAAPFRRADLTWSKRGFAAGALGDEHALPCFGELEGRRPFAVLRGGWSEAGAGFRLEVGGKEQSLWCAKTRITESDGLQLWIDTRDTHTVHRAGRFCHRFVATPLGGGRDKKAPLVAMLPIHRAREPCKPAPGGSLKAASRVKRDGYQLDVLIAAEALGGFAPAEQPRWGFSYAVLDRELGWQTWSVGPELPFMEDPSLWGTLDLESADREAPP